MMKRWIFFSAVLVSLTIYTLQYLKFPLPLWINSYVNDLLCMPIVLFICKEVVSYIFKRKIFLSLSLIIVLTLYYSWYFEYYLPKINTRYTGDYIDVFLYFIGSLLFYTQQSK